MAEPSLQRQVASFESVHFHQFILFSLTFSSHSSRYLQGETQTGAWLCEWMFSKENKKILKKKLDKELPLEIS